MSVNTGTMVAEEVVVSLSGGAPWGFRLQGGAEQRKPLQVAKVRAVAGGRLHCGLGLVPAQQCVHDV